MITVHCKHRKIGHQLHTLADIILNRANGGLLVVSCQRQDTSRHGIHNILGRRLHNNVSRKISRKCTTLTKYLAELCKLLLTWHTAEYQKVCGLLESEFAFADGSDQRLNIVSAVPQFTVTRNCLTRLIFLE